MNIHSALSLTILPLGGLLLFVPRALVQDDAAPSTPSSALVARRDLPSTIELDASLVPLEAVEISCELEEWKGELVFSEVREHGALVGAGDVIARFDTEAYDEALEEAQHALASAEIQFASTAGHAALEEEAAAERLAQAKTTLERARRDYEGYLEFELVFRERGEEIGASYARASIEDQEDELAQLEAMYKDDELVDATEEIVLKRSRRALTTSKASQKLQEERRAFSREFDLAMEKESRAEAMAVQEASFARTQKGAELDAKVRADARAKSTRAFEEQRERYAELELDRERLVLRAPRAGILLHGSLESYGPGRARPDHEVEGRVAAKSALFLVAAPDRYALALSIPESKLSQARNGMAVVAHAVALGARELSGSLDVARFPTPGSTAGPEAQWEGRVVIADAAPGLAAGMHAKAKLVTDMLEGILVVPESAVVGEGADAAVWRLDGSGQASRVPVTVGARVGGEAVVSGSIAEAERVLLGKQP